MLDAIRFNSSPRFLKKMKLKKLQQQYSELLSKTGLCPVDEKQKSDLWIKIDKIKKQIDKLKLEKNV